MGKVLITANQEQGYIMFGRKENDFITLKDVPTNDFIAAYANYLKKHNKITPPAWHDLVKTGHLHELAPYDEDWFFTKAAAVVRKVYIKPHLGVGKMAQLFGGKKRYGSARKHNAKASKGVIRAALKALEDAGILMRYNDKKNKCFEEERPSGDPKLYYRVVSPIGQKDINQIAKEVWDQLTAL